MERIIKFELPTDNVEVYYYIPKTGLSNWFSNTSYKISENTYCEVSGKLSDMINNEEYYHKVKSEFGSKFGLVEDETVRKCKKFLTKINLDLKSLKCIMDKSKQIAPNYLHPAIGEIRDWEEWEILCYQAGDFFKPHTDSKNKFTLATCLIFPPAIGDLAHQGGKLKITYPNGNIWEFESDRNTKWCCVLFEPTLVHECEPVISGNRFVIKKTIKYNYTLYDFLSSNQNNKLDINSLEQIIPENKVVDFKSIERETIKNFKNIMINKINNLDESDFSNIRYQLGEFNQDMNNEYVKLKITLDNLSNKNYDIEYILNKIKSNENNLVCVILPSFYHDLTPSNLFMDDLDLLKQIVKLYPNTSLKNISTTLIEDFDCKETRIHEGQLKDILDGLDEKKEYDWGFTEHTNIIWICPKLSSGKINGTSSEYNDSTYDSTYYMNYSCIIIAK